MHLEVRDLSPTTKRLEFELPPEAVKDALDEAYNDLQRRVRRDGFRPGKVPRKWLERLYGQQVEREVVERLISRSYAQAISERTIRAVGQPRVEEVEHEAEKPLRFAATVEVIPPIELKDYTLYTFSLKRKRITDEDVERSLESLRERAASYIDAGERPAREKDYVLLDFETFVGGEPVEEARGQDVAALVGQGSLLPEIEDALLGMSRGEERGVTARFPAEHSLKALAGREALIRVKLKDIKEPRLPEQNDEFARSVGNFDSLEALREKLREELEAAEEAAAREQLARQLLERLIEDNPFDVPPSLVEGQMDSMVRELEERVRLGGKDPAEAIQDREGLRESLRPGAERRVRELILLDQIASKEAIEVTDKEVSQEVVRMARTTQEGPAELKARLAKTGQLQSLREELRHRKTLEHLFAKVRVEEEEVENLERASEESGEGE